MKKYQWGIISTGRMAGWFCGDFHAVSNGEMLAVASRAKEPAQTFANDYAIPRHYDNYDALIADADIDIIYIASPASTHLDLAIKCMEAGKAVLCEKPVTTSPTECQKLIDAHKANNVFFMEAMWSYFLPAMQQAKQWVDEGRIGEIVQVKADLGYPQNFDPKQREWDVEHGGGALLEMGIYPIAIAQYFLEDMPDKYHAIGSFAPNGAEKDVSMMLEYEAATAILGTSYLCRQRNAAHILGRDGYIALPDAFRADEAYLCKLDDVVAHKKFPRQTRGYEYQAIEVGHFLDQGMTSSPVMPLSKSMEFQRIIENVKTIINAGRPDAP